MSKKLQSFESYLSLAEYASKGGLWIWVMIGGLSGASAFLGRSAPIVVDNAPLSYWLLFMLSVICVFGGYVLIRLWRGTQDAKPIVTELMLRYDGKAFRDVKKENIQTYLNQIMDNPQAYSSDPVHNTVLQNSLNHPSTTKEEIHNIVVIFEKELVSPVALMTFEGEGDFAYISRLHYDTKMAVFNIKNPKMGIYKIEVTNG